MIFKLLFLSALLLTSFARGAEPPEKPNQLYNLSTDPAEVTDLSARHPDLTAGLTAKLDAWNKELIAPVFPGSSVKTEDWGPGGANVPPERRAAPKGKAGKIAP